MAQDPHEADAGDEDLAIAIGLYLLGELTLGQAAERADISRIEMREVLVEAGIQPRPGPGRKPGPPARRSRQRSASRESVSQ